MARLNFTADIIAHLQRKPQLDETFRLVHFDTADDNECLSTNFKRQLRKTVHQMNTFETISECETLIKDKVADKILIIVNCPSDRLTNEMIRRVHEYRQVLAIYLIDHHRRQKIVDRSKYKKVVSVYIEEFITQFCSDQTHRQQYCMPGVSICDRLTDPRNEHFGFFFMLDRICRRVNWPVPDNPREFILACREHYAGNKERLAKVEQFEREYSVERALWWYTNEPFIYDVLNKALRTMNCSVIQLLTFFIRDIHSQLAHLHQTSAQKGILNLYRGQAMNRDEVTQLSMRIGEILSMNSFLSTSTDRDLALAFAIAATEHTPDSAELSAVLFEIEADPCLAIHAPFANICMYSSFSNEEEYLFHLNSLFHVHAVEIASQITIIRLSLAVLPPTQNIDFSTTMRTLLAEEMNDVKEMVMDSTDATNSLISLNRKIKASKVLSAIKNSNEPDKHALFVAHGDDAISWYEYSTGIEFYREALLIDPSNARTWTQLAKSYYQLNDYQQTVSLCQRAIDLDSTNISFLSTHCHRLLGISLAELGETKKALLAIERAVEIFNSIETNKSEVAAHVDESSSRLGTLVSALDKYMESRREPELLALVYEEMGITYEALTEVHEALKWFQKALDTCETIQTDALKIARLQKRIEHVKCTLTSNTWVSELT